MNGALRRVVPPGYIEAALKVEGLTPYLMRPDELDPDTDEFRAHKALSRKRGKTEDDEARLRQLDWQQSLALDPQLGPYIPSRYVHELIRSAATQWRKGEAVIRSLVVLQYRLPLEYEGPRDQAGLWEGGYRFSRLVVNNGQGKGAVYRTRPKFEPPWSFTAPLAFDPGELDPATLHDAVDFAQRYGIGDGRRIGYGAFSATLTVGETFGGGVNAKSNGKVDAVEKAVHKAKVKQLTSA